MSKSSVIQPHISPQIVGGFRSFLPRFMKRRFHCIAVNQQALHDAKISANDCVVIYANHASWWDPMIAMLLAYRIFDKFRMYAPIDAQALAKYKIFSKMGFYGIEQDSLRGAGEFLKISRAILGNPGATIWLTPEGQFSDPRDHSLPLMPGLAHLASKLSSEPPSDCPRVWFVPLAVEYPFWEESKPELLTWFGTPTLVRDTVAAPLEETNRKTKEAWRDFFFERLRATQRELAAVSIARDTAPFEVLLGGSGGSFVLYDWWRRATARVKGKQINLDHSDKFKR